MKRIAMVFAGGVGARMKNSIIPKQFLEWNGKAILIHTLCAFESHPEIDGIVIACKAEFIDHTKELIEKEGLRKVVSIVSGGETALMSQYNGLKAAQDAYASDDVVVLIHDGVRPIIDKDTISRNIQSVQEYGTAITVTKAIETVVVIGSGSNTNVNAIMDREKCLMAKAPQSFWLKEILSIHEQAIASHKHEYIDSASMMMDYGYSLHPVLGEPENIKITTPSDYYMFLGILKSRESNDE